MATGEGFSKFKEQFEDQLTCSVCLDQYTSPKTLPCHHSFCLKCIQQVKPEIKKSKCYIKCPTCRLEYLVPDGGAVNLPNAFQINSFLDLQKKLDTTQESTTKKDNKATATCPIHNDPLTVFCETCCKVICRDCAISQEHKTHDFQLISECYPKHHQQLTASLDLLKYKLAKLDTTVTQLESTEGKVLQQGQLIQKQIDTHAQNLIQMIQASQTHLSQQLESILQQKTRSLAAQKLCTELANYKEAIEHNLNEWTQQQILASKHTMMEEMNTNTKNVESNICELQPLEKPNIGFNMNLINEKNIGQITSTTYRSVSLECPPCVGNKKSTAVLTLRSYDGSLLSLPSSQISATLISPTNEFSIKCIKPQKQPGKYNIKFTPSTRHDQLRVKVSGVDMHVPDSLFAIPLKLTPKMRGKPVKIINNVEGIEGIAVFNNGDILAAATKDRLIILNKNGKEPKIHVPKKENGKSLLMNPSGMAITNDGHILVTDYNHLHKLTADGEHVQSVGSIKPQNDKTHFDTPLGVAVHPKTGQIFVADSNNSRIQVFNSNLTFSHTVTQPGVFVPSDVAIDGKGFLYVVDIHEGGTIIKFTVKGKKIKSFSSRGSAGQLYHPRSLAIQDSLVYVTEEVNHRVSIFNTNGNFLHCFGEKGTDEGQLNTPRGIAVDPYYNLYVMDIHNKRIIVY